MTEIVLTRMEKAGKKICELTQKFEESSRVRRKI